MPHQERIDPFEHLVLRLAGTTREMEPMAARIIEEGITLQDLLAPPGPQTVVCTMAVLIRAARPPFRLPDSTPLGPSTVWDIEHK